MANCKEIDITATLPWDWASRLPDSEAACFASLFFNSATGVMLEQTEIGYVPNENGGRTCMVRATICGVEALNERFLSRLVTAWSTVGTVDRAHARDIENDTDWYSIELPERID